MECLKCKSENPGGMTFEVMRVQSRKIKNPHGKLGRQLATEQELCDFEQFTICDDCIDSKLKEINNPMSTFIYRFKTAIIFLIVGVGLVISSWQKNDNGVIAGILCIVFFATKLWKFIKSSKKKKASFSKFSENNARFVAAWEVLSEVAPKRNSNNDTVFFIPVTKATREMSAEDFSKYYRLTPLNAQEFAKRLKHHKSELINQ